MMASSASYSPQQKGGVERRNQTMVAMARALLKHRGMPAKFWGEAVVTVVHLLNQSPTKSLLGKTPYEAWHGTALAVGHLRTFSCLAFAKEPTQVKKLNDRSRPCVIRYTDDAEAYHVPDPKTRDVKLQQEPRRGLVQGGRRHDVSG